MGLAAASSSSGGEEGKYSTTPVTTAAGCERMEPQVLLVPLWFCKLLTDGRAMFQLEMSDRLITSPCGDSLLSMPLTLVCKSTDLQRPPEYARADGERRLCHL